MALQHRIDFLGIIVVDGANPNGDPVQGKMPRIDYSGHGEISSVALKRKIRNRMQDLGHKIFVQSNDRCDDGFTSLAARAKAELTDLKRDAHNKKACELWADVRSFGQLFAFKDVEGVSAGIRGPVSIAQALSVDVIMTERIEITKSVNGADTKDGKRGSDTMGGVKHIVQHAAYVFRGSIYPQLAEKTGFSDEDAALIKECLHTLFENDASDARPAGTMEMHRLYWWEHNSASGQYSPARVHHTIKIMPCDDYPYYTVEQTDLPDLVPEVLEAW